jgi:hypothetical protein
MQADPLEGKTGTDKRTGQRVIRKGGQWVPLAPGGKPPVQEASMRSRMDLGLAPMVQAQQDMATVEARGNPFALDKWETANNTAAKVMSDVGISIPSMGIDWRPLEGPAKKLGGRDFQQYQQAAKAFEAQLMPMMSGAAVTPSEAERQIKAALPEPGDDEQTLQAKARTRKMMLNGAAKARNMALPYPDVPTWGVNTMRLPGQSQSETSQGQPRVRVYNPKTGRLE